MPLRSWILLLTFIFSSYLAPAQQAWSKENTVVYHWRAEPDNLHPTNGKSSSRRQVMDYTQRFLVSVDPEKYKLRPDLVVALPTVSADGLTYTYELRKEPRWDDGSSLTVDDVVFTLKANKSPLTDNSYAREYLDNLADVITDKAHPLRFQLVMKRVYMQNVSFLVDLPVMQRTFFDPGNVLSAYSLKQFDDPDFTKSQHPDLEAWSSNFNDPKYGRELALLNGLGAYTVTAWEDKQRLVLTKKKEHWTSKLSSPTSEDAAVPDLLTFEVNLDDNSIALCLRKQVIDVSTWVSTTGLQQLQKDSAFNANYYSVFEPTFGYSYLGMNMKPEATNHKPFFVDKNVRRAMALLTPVNAIDSVYFNGKGLRQSSYVSRLKASYDTTLTLLPFDIEEAKKLLDDAGWIDTDNDGIRDKLINGQRVPFEFELDYITGVPITELIVKSISRAMNLAGVQAKIHGVEFVAFYEKLLVHDFDMYMGAWNGTSFPDDPKQIWYSGNWHNGSNYVGFGSAASDQLIEAIRSSIDDQKREVLEKKLQRVIYDEQPYIFLYSPPRKIVVHRRFSGAVISTEAPGVMLNTLTVKKQ